MMTLDSNQNEQFDQFDQFNLLVIKIFIFIGINWHIYQLITHVDIVSF